MADGEDASAANAPGATSPAVSPQWESGVIPADDAVWGGWYLESFVQDGRTLTRGFGVTSVEDPQMITADTVFPIASISKTFCATALMRLAQDGRVDLRAPVRRYLPDFRVLDDAASREVSLWHLLTHTPGWEGQLNTDDVGDATLAKFTE